MKINDSARPAVQAYFNRARLHNVKFFAVLHLYNDRPYVSLVPIDEFEQRIMRNFIDLLQDHDGFRMKRFQTKDGATCRNMPMRALVKYMQTCPTLELPDVIGDAVLEHRVANWLDGDRVGDRVTEYDVITGKGEFVEVKGITSTVYYDGWENVQPYMQYYVAYNRDGRDYEDEFYYKDTAMDKYDELLAEGVQCELWEYELVNAWTQEGKNFIRIK